MDDHQVMQYKKKKKKKKICDNTQTNNGNGAHIHTEVYQIVLFLPHDNKLK